MSTLQRSSVMKRLQNQLYKYSSVIIQLNSVQVLFLSDRISAIKSVILLNINCILNSNWASPIWHVQKLAKHPPYCKRIISICVNLFDKSTSYNSLPDEMHLSERVCLC